MIFKELHDDLQRTGGMLDQSWEHMLDQFAELPTTDLQEFLHRICHNSDWELLQWLAADSLRTNMLRKLSGMGMSELVMRSARREMDLEEMG